ncbi:MAG: hypothetical protein IPL78_34285 [Chloroflexi bacterium]|nr:hypothetical protein [Chloroflexota bacterium]
MQAIYEVTEEVLLILPDLSSARLAQTDWHAVADLLAGDYNGIRLTTPAQFHLALQYANPLGIRLMRYTLAWGLDGLTNVPISTTAICREAARNTSNILTTLLPQMYLAANDDHVSKVVHDMQNKLLNVQLQHELLHRLLGWERVLPPFPLPDRHTPAQERIDANFAHLEWWSAYYSQHLPPTEASMMGMVDGSPFPVYHPPCETPLSIGCSSALTCFSPHLASTSPGFSDTGAAPDGAHRTPYRCRPYSPHR